MTGEAIVEPEKTAQVVRRGKARRQVAAAAERPTEAATAFLCKRCGRGPVRSGQRCGWCGCRSPGKGKGSKVS